MNETTSCRRTAIVALAIAVIVLLIAPGVAWGHAQLLGSSPTRGETVPASPELIELQFNEPVEASFGSLRLYDSEGRQIETGPIERPDESRETVAIRPSAELEDGSYTVTFRVVSADSHTVSGGFIFSVGAQEAPSLTVAELLEDEGDSGPVTDVVFAASRAIAYAALAAMLGGLVFLLFVWPRERSATGSDRRFSGLVRRFAIAGGSVVVACAAVGIVCQGAVASGVGIPQALDPDVLREVFETRYGETALLRVGAASVFAVLSWLAWPQAKRPGPVVASLLLVLAAAVALSFGLGGHAGAAGEAWITAPASLGHVLAMAAWFGGLGVTLWLVPQVTRLLPVGERTALLAELIGRFSSVAIAAVAILLVSGVAQAVVYLYEVAELWESGFGRAILIKAVLFTGLIAFGWYNRQRLRPRLAAAAARQSSPGRTGRALRSALRAEIVLAVGVLAVSSVLVSLAPASSMDAVFTDTGSAGPIEVEIVFEPPRVGTQETHIYLFDGVTGRQWDEIEEIRLTASEPDKEIGPLPVELQRAGPGHYLSGGHLIAVPGRWTLDLEIRASEFDSYSASFDLRIR